MFNDPNRRAAVPQPRQPQANIDPAEFVALRVIVVALVAIEANRFEAAGNGPAQNLLNELSTICQNSIIEGSGGNPDLERVRASALEYVNRILGSISFPWDIDHAN